MLVEFIFGTAGFVYTAYQAYKALRIQKVEEPHHAEPQETEKSLESITRHQTNGKSYYSPKY